MFATEELLCVFCADDAGATTELELAITGLVTELLETVTGAVAELVGLDRNLYESINEFHAIKESPKTTRVVESLFFMIH